MVVRQCNEKEGDVLSGISKGYLLSKRISILVKLGNELQIVCRAASWCGSQFELIF